MTWWSHDAYLAGAYQPWPWYHILSHEVTALQPQQRYLLQLDKSPVYPILFFLLLDFEMLILGRREYYCVDSLCDIEAMVFCFESVVIDNDLCKISVEHMSCYLKSFVHAQWTIWDWIIFCVQHLNHSVRVGIHATTVLSCLLCCLVLVVVTVTCYMYICFMIQSLAALYICFYSVSNSLCLLLDAFVQPLRTYLEMVFPLIYKSSNLKVKKAEVYL